MNREVGTENSSENGKGIDSTEKAFAPPQEEYTSISAKQAEVHAETDIMENDSESNLSGQSVNAHSAKAQFQSEQDRRQKAKLNKLFRASSVSSDEPTGEKEAGSVSGEVQHHAAADNAAVNNSAVDNDGIAVGISVNNETKSRENSNISDTGDEKKPARRRKASVKASESTNTLNGARSGHKPNTGLKDRKNNQMTVNRAAYDAVISDTEKRQKDACSGVNGEADKADRTDRTDRTDKTEKTEKINKNGENGENSENGENGKNSENGKCGKKSESVENEAILFIPHESSRELVSRIAYLAGIPKFAIFTPARKYVREVYDILESSPDARIIRNLCLLRAAMMKHIDIDKPSGTVKAPASALCVERLRADGIELQANPTEQIDFIAEINKFIDENINKCKQFFPNGIIAEYLAEIFIMPDGRSEKGIEQRIGEYKVSREKYPYQVYINWSTITELRGYLLKDDLDFVTKLYALHGKALPAAAQEAAEKPAESLFDAAIAETKPAETKSIKAESTESNRVNDEKPETEPDARKTVDAQAASETSEPKQTRTKFTETQGAEQEESEADGKSADKSIDKNIDKNVDNTEEFKLLSVIAYLAGADARAFLDEDAKLSQECFNELSTKAYAKNIRDLCIVRRSIMNEFYNINEALKDGPRALGEFPEFIPQESVLALIDNGFDISQPNSVLYQQLYLLNGFIETNIDLCKALFPEEPEWKHLRSLFIMPRGTEANGSGVSAARRFFRSNIRFTPDNVYLNWGNNGRIRNGFFKNDAAFLNAFHILHSQDDEISDDGQEEQETSEAPELPESPGAFMTDAPDGKGEASAKGCGKQQETAVTAEKTDKAKTAETAKTVALVKTEGYDEADAEAEKEPVELITLVAYMLGCKMELFLNANNQYDYKQYSELSKVQFATIIRNLCRVRSAIIDRFHSINDLMKIGNKRLSDCNHLIPASCVDSLFDAGINIAAPLDSLYEHIYRINGFIEEAIDNCKALFPTDIKWKYIRSLFIMPKGTDAAGVTAARGAYKETVKVSPDQWSYINWGDSYPQNDFFKNDDAFLLRLYRLNGDRFEVLEDEYKAFEKTSEQSETSELKAESGEAADGAEVYNVVTTAAFLLGAELRDIKLPDSVKTGKMFPTLRQDKQARILRNLCILRTAFIENFAKLSAAMRGDSDGSEGELLPAAAVSELEADGVRLDANCSAVEESIIALNRMISDAFEECKPLFPLWLDYSNVRSIFVMSDGERFSGVRRAVANYERHKNAFPGGIYMNRTDSINILENDRVFVNSVYKGGSAGLIEQSRISNRGAVQTAARLNDFIRSGRRVEFVVDCENANPLRFYSALKSIEESLIKKIAGITLYDDTNASTVWKSFSKYVNIPVVRETYERISMEKSLVDINLSVGVSRKFYKDGVDSFIIVSSDSDYWALINSIVDAKFLMLVEKNNFSDNFKRGLAMAGINFCMMDNFYSGDNDDMIRHELGFQSQRYLVEHLALNVNSMIDDACAKARIAITPTERKQLFESYAKSMKLRIAADGSVSVAVSESED